VGSSNSGRAALLLGPVGEAEDAVAGIDGLKSFHLSRNLAVA
jgi:hypothetical protein